jgi:CBS domain-containing protein
MRIREIMSEVVFTVSRDTPLKVVAERMLQYGISGMPVVDDTGRVVGVVSETDILFKERPAPQRHAVLDWLAHYGDDPPAAKLAARTAGDAMTTPAVTIAPGRLVADAAKLMLDLGIDRLPVVSGDELVGIVTRADLARAFTRDDQEIQREISEGGIVKHFWIVPDNVKVIVQDGNVKLEGELDDEAQAEALIRFAERTPGTVSIESRLTWPAARR